VEVVLCEAFLYESQAFSRYNHCLVDTDDEDDDDEDDTSRFAIDIDRKTRSLASK
jgi:hypothetical protein